MVTEEEREHVMSGNFDQLLAEQERMDRERDNEVQWRLFILSRHACTLLRPLGRLTVAVIKRWPPTQVQTHAGGD